MQSGIIYMSVSAVEMEWQSELDNANRAFAAAVGGQRFSNITREEAKRLRHPQPTPQGNALPVRA